MNSSCCKRCLLCVGAVLLFSAVLVVVCMGYAGRWLSVADSPRQADAIVVLGGAFERTLYAAELYAAGHAKTIYLSDPVRESSHRLLDQFGIKIPSEHEISAAILRQQGVAAGDIRRFPGTALSTADEAELIKSIFAGRHATLLVVTSPYHLRRARLALGRALGDTQVTALLVATPYERYAPDWWSDQDSARNTLLEIAKIAFFLTGGRFRQPTLPPLAAPAR